MVNLKETTQVRIIQSEAKTAIREERDAILTKVERIGDSIKDEMHRYFATKTDLANWQLRVYQEMDTKMRDILRLHVRKNHKISITPAGRVSIIPKRRYTPTQKASITAGILGVISAIIYAINSWLQSR